MVVVLEGSPVPRSIGLTSASFGGARMLGFLAGISIYSWLISAAIVTISFLPLSVFWFGCDLDCLNVAVKSALQITPKRKDTVRSWHLKQQVRIMWYRHEFC